MDRDLDQDAEARFDALLHAADSDPPDTGAPCPDDNLLAGLAAGHLLPAEEARVFRHLASCGACREVARHLLRDLEYGQKRSALARRGPLQRWLRAAGFVLVTALALLHG